MVVLLGSMMDALGTAHYRVTPAEMKRRIHEGSRKTKMTLSSEGLTLELEPKS